jgi:Protein of unknown function (DUF3435)
MFLLDENIYVFPRRTLFWNDDPDLKVRYEPSPIPEAIYGLSLVFDPHAFLFGLLFHAGAFLHSGLTSMPQF